MEFAQRLCSYVALLAAALLIVGLYKPWTVLWWEALQNRKKVIRVYGTASALALLVSWTISLLRNT